jgi:hypothetical protein
MRYEQKLNICLFALTNIQVDGQRQDNPSASSTYAKDACIWNRRFLVEMMHAGSTYENQIGTS